MLAAGCMVGPDYTRPAPLLPEGFRTPQAAEAQPAREAELESWWKRFDDPKLDDLIVRAQRGNITLMRAAATIAQYRSGYGISYSQMFPSLTAGANYSYTLYNFAELGAETSESTFNQWTYGVKIASWEVDLFGKIRRGMEAAQARLQESVEGWRMAMVSLRAEVATAYMNVRTLQAQRDIAVRNTDLLQQLRQFHRQLDGASFGGGGKQHQIGAHGQMAQLLFITAGLPIRNHHLGAAGGLGSRFNRNDRKGEVAADAVGQGRAVAVCIDHAHSVTTVSPDSGQMDAGAGLGDATLLARNGDEHRG
jgi:hypothetical protein